MRRPTGDGGRARCSQASAMVVAPILTYPALSRAALFSVADRTRPPLATPLWLAALRFDTAAPAASWLEPTAPLAICALVIEPPAIAPPSRPVSPAPLPETVW